MKGILKFLKTTLVGGLLFLLPVIVLVFIITKALEIAGRIVTPLAGIFPVENVFGLPLPQILAVLLIVLVCFVAGIIAKSRLARRQVRRLEVAFLLNVPGYEFLKTTFGSSIGAESERTHPVVLARIEDAWQIAFLIERLEHGHVAVYVPGAPNPLSGSVFFLTEDRIRRCEIPAAEAMTCLKRLGAGSKALLHDVLSENRNKPG